MVLHQVQGLLMNCYHNKLDTLVYFYIPAAAAQQVGQLSQLETPLEVNVE
jgi:hypothetical protein